MFWLLRHWDFHIHFKLFQLINLSYGVRLRLKKNEPLLLAPFSPEVLGAASFSSSRRDSPDTIVALKQQQQQQQQKKQHTQKQDKRKNSCSNINSKNADSMLDTVSANIMSIRPAMIWCKNSHLTVLISHVDALFIPYIKILKKLIHLFKLCLWTKLDVDSALGHYATYRLQGIKTSHVKFYIELSKYFTVFNLKIRTKSKYYFRSEKCYFLWKKDASRALTAFTNTQRLFEYG